LSIEEQEGPETEDSEYVHPSEVMEREATEEIIDFREMSTDLVVESDPEVVESDVEMGI